MRDRQLCAVTLAAASVPALLYKKECGFQLIGDGYEVIDIPEVERYDRPDVAQSLEVETEGFLPGFTVTIPEVQGSLLYVDGVPGRHQPAQ